MKNKQIIFNVELAKPTKVKQGVPPTVFTNDTNTVEFIFNVTDLEVPETATAEVNIFMRDGSFFQKDALVEGSEIRYTLSDTEGKHAGMAQIQMTLSYENKRYSTSIFQFKIDSGLNDKVAVEVLIQDWDTITTEARQYLEQMADYGTEFSEIIADARAQVNANVVEGAVENKFNALEAEYAQDITSLKQSDISLTAQLQQKANKSDIGAPTQTQVDDWLERNPTATTTVQDGAIDSLKLAPDAVTLEKTAPGELSVAISKTNALKNSLNPQREHFLNNKTSVTGQGVVIADSDTDFRKYSVEKIIRVTMNGENGSSWHLKSDDLGRPNFFDIGKLGLSSGDTITFGALGKVNMTDGNNVFSIRLNQHDASFGLLNSDLVDNTVVGKINRFKKTITLHENTKYLQLTLLSTFPYTTQQSTFDYGAIFITKGEREEQIFTHPEDDIQKMPLIIGQGSVEVDKADNGDYIIHANSDSGSIYSEIYGIGDSLMAGFFESLNAQFTWWTSQVLGKMIKNVGIFGNSSANVVSRIDDDVIQHSPSHCIISVGTNDINNGVPIATIKSNAEQITQKLLDANIQPVWIAIPPRNDFPATLPTIRSFNYWLYQLCVDKNIFFVDTYNLLAKEDGSANPIYLHPDLLHLNAEGAAVVGKEVAKAFKRLDNELRHVYFRGDDNQIIKNIRMLDTNQDGSADEWTISGNFGSNLNRRIEQINGFNYQVMEKINSVNCYADFKQNLTANVGQTYRLECNLIFENSVPLETASGLVAYIVFIDASGNAVGSYEYIIRNTIVSKIDDLRIFKLFTVPETTVTTQLLFRVTGTSDKTLKVGKINVFAL